MIEPDPAGVRAAGPPPALECPPILVVGDVHTGATWVSALLAAHPQVTVLSEVGVFTRIGLEPPLRDLHWNPEGSERMFERRMGFGQFLTRERVVSDLRTLSDRWLSRALPAGRRFLAERSTVTAAGVRAFASLYPEGSVIHVLRDGREVVGSMLAERDSTPPSPEADRESPAAWRLLWSMANGWAAHVNSLRELARATPTTVYELRHERIRACPRETARALFEHCNIPCEPDLLEQILAQTDLPPQIGPGRLSRRERAMFGAGAGELLHELGYAAAPAPGVRLLRRALVQYERAKRWI